MSDVFVTKKQKCRSAISAQYCNFVETSSLVCCGNEWADLHIIATLSLHGLKKIQKKFRE